MNGYKKWYQSKTFWFGSLYVVVAIAGLFGFASFQPSPDLVSIVGLGTGLLVIVLRLVSNKGISL